MTFFVNWIPSWDMIGRKYGYFLLLVNFYPCIISTNLNCKSKNEQDIDFHNKRHDSNQFGKNVLYHLENCMSFVLVFFYVLQKASRFVAQRDWSAIISIDLARILYLCNALSAKLKKFERPYMILNISLTTLNWIILAESDFENFE